MGQCCCRDTDPHSDHADIECDSFVPVTLIRQIRFATYGPKDTIPQNITSALRKLYLSGHTRVQSVKEIVGNSFAGKKCLVRIWFLNEEPDLTLRGGDEVELKGFVCYATYKPVDSLAWDVSEAVKDLQRKKNGWVSASAVLGNHCPEDNKKLIKVWYEKP